VGEAQTEQFHLGAEVRSSDGKEVGKLVHVLVGPDYELKALVIKESGRFSGHVLSPGSMLVNDELIVPKDAAGKVTRDQIELTLSSADIRRLPPYLAYRERSESLTEGLEDQAGVLGSGPELPNWLEQIANKPDSELEIDGGENVMLGHTGRKVGTVQDVLFDDDQLVGIVLKPEGFFRSEVILPRRFLERSDDLALFVNIEEDDLKQLKPFEARD
jgi:sporulation protein YlmC with PRC-barrel domain